MKFYLNLQRRSSGALLLLNSLSLDACFVAISWQDLVARYLDVSLRWSELLLLFLVTWLAYAGDRLLDSFQQPSQDAELPRHRFAARYRRPLGFLWSGLLVITLIIAVLTVEPSSLIIAFWLGVGVVFYFAICFFRPRLARIIIPRELVVSGIFVTAAMFFPLCHIVQSVAFSEMLPAIFLLVGMLWLLAFLNCLGISCWEQQADQNSGEATLATTFPLICTYYPLLNIALCCGLLILLFGYQTDWATKALISGVIASIVLLSCINYSKLPRNLKPVLADLSLMAPWTIYLLL
ncbi:MAG: hypothetical protein JKY95_19365 [Planctomycetaceae bacterium]|nr:hypothetical protein [Planctomycetaceae bacterium]